MSAALAVSLAANRLEYLLDSDNEALYEVMEELKEGHHELKCMQSNLREAAKKYNHDPTVNRLLSVITGYAWNIEGAIDSEFIQLMTRRLSVFEKMVLICCCNEEEESENRIIYVLKNLGGVRDAYFALSLREKL